jgi:hypothetical protein
LHIVGIKDDGALRVEESALLPLLLPPPLSLPPQSPSAVERMDEETSIRELDWPGGSGRRGRINGMASRDPAALQKAPSKKRARRRDGEGEEQFKQVKPCGDRRGTGTREGMRGNRDEDDGVRGKGGEIRRETKRDKGNKGTA